MQNLVKKAHDLEVIKTELSCIGNLQEVYETFEEVKIIVSDVNIEEFLLNTSKYKNIFLLFFDILDKNDKLDIIIHDDIDSKKATKIDSFQSLEDLESYSYLYNQEDTIGFLEIHINKSFYKLDYVTIYSVDALVSYLNNKKNVEYIFELFSTAGNSFKIIDGKAHFFNTNNFVFADAANFEARTERIIKKINITEKNKKREKINENCHFANITEIAYLPESVNITV